MIESKHSSRAKRILVVSPPYRLSQVGFPLGLMYIGAILERAGHQVEVIDMDVENLSMDDYVQELNVREYDYFLTGGMITCWNFVVFSCNYIKKIKPDVKIVAGGGIVSSTPQSLLSAATVDIGCIGEGEDTILDIIDAYENNKPLANVSGIVYKEGDQVVQTAKRTDIQDLDALPFPAWDLFNVSKTYIRYPSHHSFLKAKRSAWIYTTRGCPFMCTFCYTEKAVRQRSVENVMAEIRELKERYGIGHINLSDDLFVVRKKRAIEFCEALIKNKMNVTWSATGRCNIIDPEFLKIMKAAGCEFMGLGIESGSDSVLRAIKKNQTPKQIVEAVKMVQKAGIVPGGTFILGLPPETKETVRETVETYKAINSYRNHVNRFFYATPYPGTPLYDEMVAKNRIGDEIRFFEQLSEKGDAVGFVINCTDAFSDEELITTKREIETEVFNDFMRKHPWDAFSQFLSEKTKWGSINNLLVVLKLKGLREAIRLLVLKFKVAFKIVQDPYMRRWNRKNYAQKNIMYEGTMSTF
ncbi:MAG: hypothetical protein A3A81_01355 [Omnitrophica bacterium RIFCSPLOWO2_01_FULL_45_10b]|nr:MAG: hypothetical protein A3A81_01355 [Omnitrophica bacterium RIFCSPLOWO2_01_FULL_45_10b]